MNIDSVSALELLVKALLLPLPALLLLSLLRRGSAAMQHLVLLTALCMLLTLPAFALLLPAWSIDLPAGAISVVPWTSVAETSVG